MVKTCLTGDHTKSRVSETQTTAMRSAEAAHGTAPTLLVSFPLLLRYLPPPLT